MTDEKKIITVVCGSNDTRDFAISNETEFQSLLGLFQAVGLEDTDNGLTVLGYKSLDPGKRYTATTTTASYPAPVSPFTPPSQIIRSAPTTPTLALLQRLPRSPPRNGIGEVQLQRNSLVGTILENANPIVVVRSPPATGKTSLLDLIQSNIDQRENSKLVRLTLRGGLTDEKLIECLFIEIFGYYEERQSINALTFSSLTADTWILLDDAQLAFQNKNFWKVVVKDLEAAGRKVNNLHVVIAGTYDLASQGSPPYHFSEYRPMVDFQLTKEEAEQIYDEWMDKIYFANEWIGFKDTLLRLADGHVGVITGGISMILRVHKSNGND